MTDPRDPGDDDWGFPEVDPASLELPSAEPEEPVYDTGSDAWWRQQAEAQRRAAASDPVVPPAPPTPPPAPEPPPELVEPEVLNAPSPLDSDWVPPELPELRPPAEDPVALDEEPDPLPEPADDPVAEPDFEDGPEDVADDSLDDATTAYGTHLEDRYDDEDPTGEIPAVHEEPGGGPEWFRGLVEPTVATVAAPMPAEVPPPAPEPADRAPEEPQKVGPARALAGAALALAGVLLGIGALFVLNGDEEPTGGPTVNVPSSTPSVVQTTAAPSATASPSVSPSAPAVVQTSAPPVVAEAPLVPVRVLNNSRVKGLADRAAQRFRAGGWDVPQTGNYRGGTIAQTTVYYDTGQQASAERFAKQFGIPRVAPRFPGIPVPGMTVILTRDYSA